MEWDLGPLAKSSLSAKYVKVWKIDNLSAKVCVSRPCTDYPKSFLQMSPTISEQQQKLTSDGWNFNPTFKWPKIFHSKDLNISKDRNNIFWSKSPNNNGPKGSPCLLPHAEYETITPLVCLWIRWRRMEWHPGVGRDPTLILHGWESAVPALSLNTLFFWQHPHLHCLAKTTMKVFFCGLNYVSPTLQMQ